PFKRQIPFERIELEIKRTAKHGKRTIDLQRLEPDEDDGSTDAHSVVNFLLGDMAASSVGFLDLARHTAGDDWSYVNALILNLPSPAADSAAPLVVIDSVAGLATLAGDYDAYGVKQSRR